MPLSSKVMAMRARIHTEDLALKAEIFELEALSRIKPRKNTMMAALMEVIHNLYSDYVEESDDIKGYVPSSHFMQLRQSYSPPTLVKAKLLLGIKSKRIGTSWYWSLPRRAPTEALQAEHTKRILELNTARTKLKHLNRMASLVLLEIMKSSNFEVTNKDCLKEMAIRGYSRNTTLSAKSELHIVSLKYGDEWHWLYPDESVQEWITEKLKRGPVPVEKLRDMAWAEHQWPFELLRVAKDTLGGIKFQAINNKICWYDINGEKHDTSSVGTEINGAASEPRLVADADTEPSTNMGPRIIDISFPDADEGDEQDGANDAADGDSDDF